MQLTISIITNKTESGNRHAFEYLIKGIKQRDNQEIRFGISLPEWDSTKNFLNQRI